MAKKEAPQSNKLMTTVIVMVVMGALFAFAPGAAAIVVVGMAPSLVFWMVDSHAYRALRLKIVFVFNIAGVIPFVPQAASGDLRAAVDIINDGISPMIMLGAAGVGMAILKMAPAVATFFMEVVQGERSRRVVTQQKKLVEIWGKDIVSSNSNFFNEVGIDPENKK